MMKCCCKQNGSQTINNITQIVDGRPYKAYAFNFLQSGTANPSINELENALGDSNLSWSRDGVGNFSINSPDGVFTENKTFMTKHIEHAGLNRWIAGRRIDDGTFQIITYGNSVPADGINNTDSFPTFLEIRVYD